MVKYMNNQNPKRKRKNEDVKGSVFTFFSTASAVGKTVLAVNYAADLAERGYKVCLADLDLQFGDVCNYLGIKPVQTFFDYYEQGGILAVEWSENIENALPENTIRVTFERGEDEKERIITVEGQGEYENFSC